MVTVHAPARTGTRERGGPGRPGSGSSALLAAPVRVHVVPCSSREMAQPPPSRSLSTVTTVSRGASRSPWDGFLGDRAPGVMGARPLRGQGPGAAGQGSPCIPETLRSHASGPAVCCRLSGKEHSVFTGVAVVHCCTKGTWARVRHLPWDSGPPWEQPGLLGGGPGALGCPCLSYRAGPPSPLAWERWGPTWKCGVHLEHPVGPMWGVGTAHLIQRDPARACLGALWSEWWRSLAPVGGR